MPCGKKRKRHKIATHKRKKRLERIVIRRTKNSSSISLTGLEKVYSGLSFNILKRNFARILFIVSTNRKEDQVIG